ncbi:MAG: CinA family protein [Rothia sp. (in: high G+C Gram-positive bacteria)]|nr:CinA family protein [Rothia sp. (in: high G+C Gram-positive bacteria)]
MNDFQSHDAAAAVVARAVEHGWTIASAESLTGGEVGSEICSVPGASATYMGGIISYSSQVKATVLGVDSTLLEQAGSVDARVAEQMAQGAARVCSADFAVATTGVAGPEPHDGKPVGRVHLGISSPAGTRAVEKNYVGDRAQIRKQATDDALKLLEQEMTNAPSNR